MMLEADEATRPAEHTLFRSTGAARGFDLRGTLAGAAKVIISVVFLWIALRGVDWPALVSRIGGADPWLVTAAVILLAVQLVLFAFRWRFVAMSGTRHDPARLADRRGPRIQRWMELQK